MTRDDNSGDSGQKQQNPGGDLTAEDTGTAMTEAEATNLGARPGRGARQEEGADPSDDYVFEHIEGGEAGGSKKPVGGNQD